MCKELQHLTGQKGPQWREKVQKYSDKSIFFDYKGNLNLKFLLGGTCRSEKVENNQWSALLEQKVTNCASSEECPPGKPTYLF